MNSEIKKCPACGSRKVTVEDWTEVFYIFCEECGLSSPERKTKKGAIDIWNRIYIDRQVKQKTKRVMP